MECKVTYPNGRELSRVRTANGARYALVYDMAAIWELIEPNGNTTSQIAKKAGCSYNCAYSKLRELQKEGKVAHKEIGRTFLWVRVGIHGNR